MFGSAGSISSLSNHASLLNLVSFVTQYLNDAAFSIGTGRGMGVGYNNIRRFQTLFT